MRVPTTRAFDQWLLQRQPWYPWGNLQATRNSIFCKWVILTGTDNFHEYFPVLANSFSNGVLLEMLRNGDARPLPLELSQVIDGLHWWGTGLDHHWRDLVVMRVVQFANGHVWDKREMVRIMINMRVQDIIDEVLEDSVAADLVFVDWIQWFNGTYKKEDFDGAYSFKDIAKSCFKYVEESVADMHNGMVRAHAVNSA